ncbi:NAD(P)/FAD-dependent oxidoreductase [Pseudactinotalea sp. Z1739]|uniref:NAD(P)/FAD-dependent oxidoreductase n=1 Tax=Pseudactinotalea sp. Z1739 TaxID=3413028 RepID=UPI003C7E9372
MDQTTTKTRNDQLPAGLVDVAVIGGGAAGLNGALMLARSRRTVVVIDSASPRNAPAEGVHGLLGLEGIAPAELYRRGREEVRSYGGLVVDGAVAAAVPAAPGPDGDLRFTLTLADGRTLTARRILVATGVRDVLPDIPGLAQHWGVGLVHCPYCHGWEVRDEPIGILAVGPGSRHATLLFRQLSEDVIVFANGTDLDADTRARFAVRGTEVIDGAVTEVVADEAGGIAGVRLDDGTVVARRVLTVMTQLRVRTEGLDGLQLPMADLPGGTGRHFVTEMAGSTAVPGVWVAGNAAEPMTQVGASAAAGALAGGHINADLVGADTDAALGAAARAA